MAFDLASAKAVADQPMGAPGTTMTDKLEGTMTDESVTPRAKELKNVIKPSFDLGSAKPVAESNPSSSVTTPSGRADTLGRPTQKEEPTNPYIVNQAKKGFAGLGGLLGAGVDLATYPTRKSMDAVPWYAKGAKGKQPPTEPMPLSKAYAVGAPALLGYNPDMPVPKDEYGKPKLSAEMLGNMSEFAGASVMPSAGVIAKSATPLRAAFKELAGIGLSGEGQEMGRNMAPQDHKELGGFLGSLTGPMLAQKAIDGLSVGGNWIKQAGKEKLGVTGFSDKTRQQDATRHAAKELGSQLDSPLAQENMAEAKRLGGFIPNFGKNLTLGRMSNVPSIKASEGHFASTDADAMDLARQREQGLGKAITAQKDLRFPPSSDESVTPLSGAQRMVEAKTERLDAGLKRLEDQERTLVQQYQRGDQEAAGVQAQSVRTQLATQAKAAASQRYNLAFDAADKAGLKVNMLDVKDLAQSITGDSGLAFQDQPAILRDIIAKYSGKTEDAAVKQLPRGQIRTPATTKEVDTTAKLDEFQSLYIRANADAKGYRLQASAGNPDAAMKAAQVEKVRDLLQSKIKEMEGPEHGEVGKLFADANTFYRTKYADLFRRGVGGEMGVTGRFGATSSNENAKIFSNLVLKPNDPSGMREYLAMMGGDKKGMNALENGVMDIMAREVTQGKDGSINRTSLANFLNKHKQSLDLVPELRSRIETVDSAARSFAENRARILEEKKVFAKDTLIKVAKSDNPENTVSEALRSPRVMESLLRGATTGEEKQAVARSLLEVISKQSNPVEFFTNNRKMLESALGKKQASYMNTILEAQAIKDRVKAPTSLAYEQLTDPLEKATGTSIRSMSAMQRSISQGRGSIKDLGVNAGVRWWNKIRTNQRDQIIMEAIYNPDVAEALAAHLAKPTEKTAKALNPHLIPYAIRAGVAAYDLAAPSLKSSDNEQKTPNN